MEFLVKIVLESWELLRESAVYVIFGLVVAGLLKVFLSPSAVARHLGHGRVMPVFKAALLGVPMPLCSCGVLPAAAALKRQGANTGATTAFLISTPESGVDSIAISYALLDPVLTIARPLVAAVTAVAAGIMENLFGGQSDPDAVPDLSCPVDRCCDGANCDPEEHRRHHTRREKVVAGMRYAFGELWNDLAGWFLVGIIISGVIAALVPEDALSAYLGGGIKSMLLMLVIGIPIYICATGSTPIAASLILKGVSPGAALVFLLAGPATNMTSLTVLIKVLGRRATAIYLAAIAVSAVSAGLLLDWVYGYFGLSARALVGQASEVVPMWAQIAGAVILLGLSAKPVYRTLRARLTRSHAHEACGCSSEPGSSCGCSLDDDHDHDNHDHDLNDDH